MRRVALPLLALAVAILSGCISVGSQDTYYDDPYDDCWIFCGGDSYSVTYDYTFVLVPIAVVVLVVGLIIAAVAASDRREQQQQQQVVIVHEKKE